MPHVVKSFRNVTFEEAPKRLLQVHKFLVSRAKLAINESVGDEYCWGTSMKRSPVNLAAGEIPELIGKPEEKLGEVINIAATIERLIDGIKWLASQPENEGYSVLECHPSTSDESNSNDLGSVKK